MYAALASTPRFDNCREDEERVIELYHLCKCAARTLRAGTAFAVSVKVDIASQEEVYG